VATARRDDVEIQPRWVNEFGSSTLIDVDIAVPASQFYPTGGQERAIPLRGVVVSHKVTGNSGIAFPKG